MRFEIFALTVGNLVALSMAHMELVSPAPRRSRFSPTYTQKGDVDYDMSTPLGHRFPFPCRGIAAGPSVATYTAGESVNVTLGGMAVHNGGHCQFALSIDGGKTFVVLKTVMGSCLVDGLSYQVPLPTDMPNGEAVFAWTWINKTGNREYYMNCADVTIKGGKGTSLSGPKLLVVNMENAPTIPEFANGGDDGAELMNKRPIVTSYKSGDSSEATEAGAGVEAETEPEPEIKKEVYKKKASGRKDYNRSKPKAKAVKKPSEKSESDSDNTPENKESVSNSDIKKKPATIKSEKSESDSIPENKEPASSSDVKKKVPTAKSEPDTVPENKLPASTSDVKKKVSTTKPEADIIPENKEPASSSDAKNDASTTKPVLEAIPENKESASSSDIKKDASTTKPELKTIPENKESASSSDVKKNTSTTKSESEVVGGNKVEPSSEAKNIPTTKAEENALKDEKCATQCLEGGKFQLCIYGHLYNMRCATGTQCMFTNGEIHCDY